MQNQVLKPENKLTSKKESEITRRQRMWLQIHNLECPNSFREQSWQILHDDGVVLCWCWCTLIHKLHFFNDQRKYIYSLFSLGPPTRQHQWDQWNPWRLRCCWHHFSWERRWRCQAGAATKSWGWGWMVVNKALHSFLKHHLGLVLHSLTPIKTAGDCQGLAQTKNSEVHA